MKLQLPGGVVARGKFERCLCSNINGDKSVLGVIGVSYHWSSHGEKKREKKIRKKRRIGYLLKIALIP